jgi:hypothetical protein
MQLSSHLFCAGQTSSGKYQPIVFIEFFSLFSIWTRTTTKPQKHALRYISATAQK